jgi:serine/threonine-protein kinase
MSTIPQPGTTLGGKYLVDQVLGVGGMGVVVAATHLQLDQKVALKFLLPEALQNPEVVARFSREARAAAKIRGEHVARVIDVGAFDDGTPFMVMEYLEGHDLSKQLEVHGPLPVEDVARHILETCEALAEAHAAKIVHRDLKPSNMFLAQQPDKQAIIKVLDFGISKLEDKPTAGLTKTSALMGTAFYMSPEQLTAPKTVDHRSDIWALGVIMYELLTSKQPFAGESVPEIVASILQGQREPLTSARPDVPPGVSAAIDRCLMFKAADRFANVAELAAAIAPFAIEDARRSVAVIGRVLGEHVPLAPPSTVVRPLAATSLPSAIEATQLPPVQRDTSADQPSPTTALSPGAVTAHGLSASVAGLPKPTNKPAVIIAAVAVVAVVGIGIGLAMKSGGPSPAASGLVSAPPEVSPSATSASAALPSATPPSAAQAGTLVMKPLDPAPAPAPTESVAVTTTPSQPTITKTATHVPPKSAPVAPVPPAASAKPVGPAVATATPPSTATAAPPAPTPNSNTSKNPLQMGIK